MIIEEKEKKSKSMVFGIIALVFALGLMGYFLFFTGEETGNTITQVGEMQQLTGEVRAMETDIKQKEGEMVSLTEAYQNKTGQVLSIGFNPASLSPEAQELFKQRIATEKDVSIKSLLEEILQKSSEIKQLKIRIAKIEKLLPTPHIVTQGENHYQIALEYLMNEQGFDKEEATKLLERTALFDELAPGFKVWNFYADDEYGTSVTQGNADISPNFLIHMAKKKLTNERDLAVAERDKLSVDIKDLEEKSTETALQINQLSREQENLITAVSDLTQQVNSLFFLLDSQRNLKKKGILKSSFLSSAKLRDVSPEFFTRSIDLRTKDQVLISASELGIGKIKDVNIYPNIYKKGNSYKIEMTADKRYALLTLLEKEIFKNERLVIAVR